MDIKIELIILPMTDVDRAELSARGVAASEVAGLSSRRLVTFGDPDGNGWSLQQLPQR